MCNSRAMALSVSISSWCSDNKVNMPPSNCYFALKIMKKSEVVRLKQVEHIKNEKEILSEVNHPFIVTLYCAFQDERNLYMLLEFIIGGELFTHLRKAGKFANDHTRFYAAQIVMALQYLHNDSVVYRDLKPENLLLDLIGYLKITDFGFAKKVEDRTWTLCGTPEYLAPEIIQSKGHGKAVDWWASGILMYEMLVGHPPFMAENQMETYHKIMRGKYKIPDNVNVDNFLLLSTSSDTVEKVIDKLTLVLSSVQDDEMREVGYLQAEKSRLLFVETAADRPC